MRACSSRVRPTSQAGRRLALALDRTALAIQGPPGSGKTYTGARMIVSMVKAGKKVGITGTSHKVIGNLLKAALDAAALEFGRGSCQSRRPTRTNCSTTRA